VAGSFEGTTVIDKPIEEVFDFLADGSNDPKFSPRVQEIKKLTDGPIGVGTIFESTVKDAGMKTGRQFELTEFERPTKIRWAERTKNMITADEGGYDFSAEGDGTKVRIYNVLNGHGFGKLLLPLALSAARKDAPKFAERIKTAVEAS
jgi:hypothetical protein